MTKRPCTTNNCTATIAPYNKTGFCAPCYRAVYRSRNKDIINKKLKAYYASHKEQYSEKARAYREANKTELKTKRRLYYQTTYKHSINKKEVGKRYRSKPEVIARNAVWRQAKRELLLEYKKQHYNKNSAVYKANAVKRKVSIKNRLPKWLSTGELKAIRDFYKNRPDGYHVDHIIPLNGENVSGLHTLANLQYLPAMENLKKSNKF